METLQLEVKLLLPWYDSVLCTPSVAALACGICHPCDAACLTTDCHLANTLTVAKVIDYAAYYGQCDAKILYHGHYPGTMQMHHIKVHNTYSPRSHVLQYSISHRKSISYRRYIFNQLGIQ